MIDNLFLPPAARGCRKSSKGQSLIVEAVRWARMRMDVMIREWSVSDQAVEK